MAVGGFDERYWLAEDNDFILRLLTQGELVRVPQKLVYYRRHSGNTSRDIVIAAREVPARYLPEHIAHARARGDRSCRASAASFLALRE